MRAVFARQVVPAIAALCADPAEAPGRAGLVSSQFLGLAMTRYLLKLPPVVAMKRADVISWLAPTVQRYVCGTRGS